MGLGHIFEGHHSTYHAPLENNSFWKQRYLRFETKKPLKCVFHLSQPSFKVGKILQEANPESRELSACTFFRWWSSKSQSEEARQEGEEAKGGCRIKLPSPWEVELSPLGDSERQYRDLGYSSGGWRGWGLSTSSPGLLYRGLRWGHSLSSASSCPCPCSQCSPEARKRPQNHRHLQEAAKVGEVNTRGVGQTNCSVY